MTTRLSLAGAILLLLVLPSVAQQNSSFIFRLAHRDGSDSTCVIVRENGTFHLERNHHRQVQVFEGTLSADRLEALNSMLNSDRFRRLSSEAVAIDLRPSGLDELTLSVPRQDQWVSLRFLSAWTHDADRSLLNRFLAWNNGVLKSPHKKLREESARNNCLPADQVELKSRPE